MFQKALLIMKETGGPAVRLEAGPVESDRSQSAVQWKGA